MSFLDQPTGTCKCGRAPNSGVWSCCVMCANHGDYEQVCDICTAERMLAHAEERAAAVPALREKLRALVGALESKKGSSS